MKLLPDQPKSIFTSVVFWSTVVTAITSISPYVTGYLIEDRKPTAKDVDTILAIVLGSCITILGRIQSTSPVYTPHGFIGSNREDFYDDKGRLIDRRENTSYIDESSNTET